MPHFYLDLFNSLDPLGFQIHLCLRDLLQLRDLHGVLVAEVLHQLRDENARLRAEVTLLQMRRAAATTNVQQEVGV